MYIFLMNETSNAGNLQVTFICVLYVDTVSFPSGHFVTFPASNNFKMKFLYLFTLLLVGLSVVSSELEQEVLPGGISTQDIPATAQVCQLVKGIHSQIKAHLLSVPGGANIVGKVRPISYRTQLVNGINYFVKVRASTPRKHVYYHLRIYKSFEGKVQLLKIVGPKLPDDTITFF